MDDLRPPKFPTQTQMRDKRIREIIGVMVQFEAERQKARLLPTDTVPEKWRRGAEAVAIYDLFVRKD